MIKLNEGDTLAIKIENYNKEFDGKYFLFIKAEDFSEKYGSTTSKKLFRAKIIDSIDNIDFNTINNLEYIKKELILWERRFYPYIGLETYDDAEKNRKTIFYPDEFNYLYSYIFELNITKKDLDKFIYLGNYKVDLPKELIPSWPALTFIHIEKSRDFISELTDNYCWFNLRKSIFFTEEGIEKYKKLGKLIKDISNNEPKEFKRD